MIKLIRPTLLVLLAAFSLNTSAQKISQTDSLNKIYANKRAQSVYFEGLGAGGVYSFNYDTRFKKRQDGLGGRVGISYFSENDDRLFTIPVVINYLLGKNGKYFEIGAGATFFQYSSYSSNTFFGNSNSYYDYINYPEDYSYERHSQVGAFGSLNFGYRYQPADGGFSFRGGFSPIFSSHDFVPYWPYLSFGYTF
ncbi:hypothetical protein [Mucilaginibacter gilvus]|uniref:Outer membrane protein beta-barrel domain-containing protein n=1 Tax=Mucilaginibacter gilvus TaxID=2305909 RepID=A0A444MN45_9SPHI|nr:hypothetical protein [Mucilaginibacter gilvus]RWY51131.1 hypothetical protein EPL05_13780 [Mucilaginibacter gilvus]